MKRIDRKSDRRIKGQNNRCQGSPRWQDRTDTSVERNALGSRCKCGGHLLVHHVAKWDVLWRRYRIPDHGRRRTGHLQRCKNWMANRARLVKCRARSSLLPDSVPEICEGKQDRRCLRIRIRRPGKCQREDLGMEVRQHSKFRFRTFANRTESLLRS